MEIESAGWITGLVFDADTWVLFIIIEDKRTIVVDEFIELQKNEGLEKYFIEEVIVYDFIPNDI